MTWAGLTSFFQDLPGPPAAVRQPATPVVSALSRSVRLRPAAVLRLKPPRRRSAGNDSFCNGRGRLSPSRFSVSLLFSAAVISGNQGDLALRRIDLNDVFFQTDVPAHHAGLTVRACFFCDPLPVQCAFDQFSTVRAEPTDLPPFRFRSSESAQSFFLFLYDFSILFSVRYSSCSAVFVQRNFRFFSSAF